MCPGWVSTYVSPTATRFVDLATLADEQWIGITRDVSPDYHDEMAATFRAAGFAPRMDHTARSIASQIAICATGAGVSIVPVSATRELPRAVTVRRTTSITRTVTLAVSTRRVPDSYERLLHLAIDEVTRGS